MVKENNISRIAKLIIVTPTFSCCMGLRLIPARWNLPERSPPTPKPL